MPGKIFVNYRRDDVPGDARGIHDGLVGKFGKSNVFMDVDNLLAGQRFDKELEKALEACDVLIAVMGPRWMELLSDRTASGDRDYVREEIAAALKRDIVVIPVRVGHDGRMAPLPRRDELQEDIRDLVLHQKHDIAHERFRRDITDLCAAIATVRRNKRPPLPWRRIAAGVSIALLLGGGVLANQAGLLSWPTSSPGPQDTSAAQRATAAAAKKAAEDSKRLAEAAEPLSKREADAFRKGAADAAAQRKADDAERQRIADIKADMDRKTAELNAKWDAEQLAKHDPALAVTPGSGKSFQDNLADGSPCPTCPQMVVVPSGTFSMGSTPTEIAALKKEFNNIWHVNEGPQHTVKIEHAFAVGKFPVTFDEWDACVADSGCNGYKPGDQGWGRGNRPAISVSWDDAKTYVAWLSLKTGKTYRLLSEAEREYVARAATTTPFWWGTSISTKQANYDGNYSIAGSPKGEYRQKTLPVESFEPNPWGLYQVHGNVYDWVEDCWHDTYQGAPADGSAWTTSCADGSSRVVRGGSWGIFPRFLRSAFRCGSPSDDRGLNFGFRVGRTLTP